MNVTEPVRIRIAWDKLTERRYLSESKARRTVRKTGQPKAIVYASGRATMFYLDGATVRQITWKPGEWTGYHA